MFYICFFFFQAEDGIRDLVRSRGLGMCIRDSDKIVKNGKISTNKNQDHTLKIDVDNLRQDTIYYLSLIHI